ncbi:TatD family hydrolase [Bacteroidia bacterium]|nr:TatD family hydrolase [Bacteroidia bacterium]
MIDTHCHIYDPAYDADRDAVMERTRQAGVRILLMPGVDSGNYAAMMNTAAKYPHCYPMIGLHPTSVNANWQQEVDFVAEKLSALPAKTFVAVGEIGMDSHYGNDFLKEQKAAFAAQLALAEHYNLPVVIHSREAFVPTFEVLDNYSRPLRGVFHAFSGTLDNYHQIRQYGDFKIGVGGVVTFKNAHLAEVVRAVPLHDILLETDAPYLTPVPFRGKRNESTYLNYIVQKIAELKNISIAEVQKITTENAIAMFCEIVR